VTIGSPLSGAYFTSTFSITGTVANSILPEPGADLTSPAAGTIVRWRIMDGSGGPYRLRVLTPAGGTAYTGGAASEAETPASLGVEAFSTDLPIQTGQTIGLDNTSPSDTIGDSEFPGGADIVWAPSLGLGETLDPTGGGGNEFSFNADVVIPVPEIVAISPSSGPTAGGTAVTITGHDLSGASAVKFGAAAASGFTVGSSSEIAAVAPPSANPGPVDVSVTTVGGTSAASAADRFTYTAPTTAPTTPACVVPKLKGTKLKAAKKKLKKANCKLGKVKHMQGKKARKGKRAEVIGQSPKPGKVLAPGAKVNVKLTPLSGRSARQERGDHP
jgi:hypothetical protein